MQQANDRQNKEGQNKLGLLAGAFSSWVFIGQLVTGRAKGYGNQYKLIW